VAYTYEIYVNDYKVDVIHVEPFLLVEGSIEYVELGSHVAKAFSIGKTITNDSYAHARRKVRWL